MMKYTDALKKLFEIMDGRPDIEEIRFNRENDSFDVISNSNVHTCFGDEFRDITNDKIDSIISTIEEHKQYSDTISCQKIINMLKQLREE